MPFSPSSLEWEDALQYSNFSFWREFFLQSHCSSLNLDTTKKENQPKSSLKEELSIWSPVLLILRQRWGRIVALTVMNERTRHEQEITFHDKFLGGSYFFSNSNASIT